MLWNKALLHKALLHKAWIETRFRVLLLAAIALSIPLVVRLIGARRPLTLSLDVQAEWMYVALLSVMLAGTGIATQPGFQNTKGLHGSTAFTLALPVTRLRLLTVRAGLGWMLLIGANLLRSVTLWYQYATPSETGAPWIILQQAATLVACSTGIYALSVLSATFLDDYWRFFVSFAGIRALKWFFTTPLPDSVNIMEAMGQNSPMMTHTMPWAAMAFSVGLAALLFFASLKIVQRREY
jgi:hypothetical protein